MIRHIVMFRMHSNLSSEKKIKAAEMVKDELMKMRTKIPVIVDFEVGINISSGEFAWDLVLNSTFNSLEDLETYRTHPDHQAFIRFNKDFSERKAIVDFDFP